MGPRHALSDLWAGRARRPLGTNWYLAAPGLVILAGFGRSVPTATSLVAATGLGVLACTDATTRRLPRPIVRILALSLAATLTGSCAVHGAWEPLLRAALWGAAVAVGLGAVWWAVPDALAFGDVKITALAAAAAAADSWRSVVAMLLLSCVASAGYAVLIRMRRKSAPAWDMTVPFAPGLAVGFVAAVSLW